MVMLYVDGKTIKLKVNVNHYEITVIYTIINILIIIINNNTPDCSVYRIFIKNVHLFVH